MKYYKIIGLESYQAYAIIWMISAIVSTLI